MVLGQNERGTGINRQNAQLVDKNGNPVPHTPADQRFVGDAASLANKLEVMNGIANAIPDLSSEEKMILFKAMVTKGADGKPIATKAEIIEELSKYTSPIFTHNAEDGTPDPEGAAAGLQIRSWAIIELAYECEIAGEGKKREKRLKLSWLSARQELLAEQQRLAREKTNSTQETSIKTQEASTEVEVIESTAELEMRRRSVNKFLNDETQRLIAWDNRMLALEKLPEANRLERLFQRLDVGREQIVYKIGEYEKILRATIAALEVAKARKTQTQTQVR